MSRNHLCITPTETRYDDKYYVIDAGVERGLCRNSSFQNSQPVFDCLSVGSMTMHCTACASAVTGVVVFLVYLFLKFVNKRLIKSMNFPEMLFSMASAGGFFTSFLNIHNCIEGKIVRSKGKISFAYLVPHHLSTEHNVLDLGAILSLGDEISTVVLVCEDKTYRAGVTVSLTGEILRPEEIKAGETVWIETMATKIGSALGFAEVLFWRSHERSELLARVSHVKYMQAGGALYAWLSPLLPTLGWLAFKYKWLGDEIKSSEYLPLAKLLNIQQSSEQHAEGTYDLVAHHKIQNFFKTLHGGALSMSITDAVTKYHQSQEQKNAGNPVCSRYLRWMEMQYLSPCKGRVRISINPQVSTKGGLPPPNDSLEHVHSFRILVKSDKDNKLLAQGSVIFY